VEYGQGPRSGARDNGLRCAGYAAVGDLDPRIADSLLETLRSEGIAAYVVPTPSTQGGYLEMHPPSHVTDRLYADIEHTARARELLPAADPTPEIDFDSAWQQVLQSLQSGGDEPMPQWPTGPSTGSETTAAADPSADAALTDDSGAVGIDPALEDHFVPPQPPPFPRLRRVTVISLLAIAAGIVILATNLEGGSLSWLGIIAIVAGVATLVWHMKDGPPVDSGWDDGAIV
jgi:hypothetical protein